MTPAFIDIVKKLVSEQGKEALLNPAKAKSLLADYARGEFPKVRRLLIQALEAGVGKVIDETRELEICKLQQVQRLQDDYFIDKAMATDVVNVLCLILHGEAPMPIVEPMSENEPVNTPRPKQKRKPKEVPQTQVDYIYTSIALPIESANEEKLQKKPFPFALITIHGIIQFLITYFIFKPMQGVDIPHSGIIIMAIFPVILSVIAIAGIHSLDDIGGKILFWVMLISSWVFSFLPFWTS